MHPKKFTASTAWADAMAGFDPETRCEVYDALFEYADKGETHNLSPRAAAAFAFIKMDIDIERAKQEAKREKCRANINKRWEKEQANPGGRRTPREGQNQ